MPFQKGHKLAKGRPKGTKNLRTLLVEEIAAKYKFDPFEILIMIAAGDWKGLGYDNECYFSENAQGPTKMGYTITPEMRLAAAKEAAQYLHSKRKEEVDKPDEIEVYSLEDKKKLAIQAEKELQKLKEEIDAAIQDDNRLSIEE